jgi:hypothetical protein
MDDFSPLSNTDLWLGWLGDDPVATVRSEIEVVLQKQVPSARLRWVRILDTPYYLMGGRKQDEEPNTMLTTRAVVALLFELEVESLTGLERLTGVFSWVATRMDRDRVDRVHLDLEPGFWHSPEFKLRTYERLYEADRPEDEVGDAPGQVGRLQSKPAAPTPWWQIWRRKR